MAIALTVLLTSQSQSLSLAREAKFGTTASLLAQSKMAEIDALGTENLQSDAGDFGDTFPDYHWEIVLHNVSILELEKSQDYLRQIDLNIYFGEDRQYEYTLRLYRFVPESNGP